MAAPIVQLPKGLLGFLQLKGQGQVPQQLLETLQPTIDLFGFYSQWTQVDQNFLAGGNSAAAGVTTHGFFGFTTFPLTVPQDQLWYVHHYAVWAGLLAADYIRLAPMVLAGAATYTTGPDANDVVTARARSIVATSYGPFWAPSGAQLGVAVFDINTAGGITINAAIRATPFLV